MIKNAIAFLFVFVFSTAYSESVSSIKSGQWGDPSVWSTGFVPGQTDSVVINMRDTISVSVNSALCDYLELQGAVIYKSQGKSLSINKLVAKSGAFVFSKVGGELNVESIEIDGETTLQGVNIIASENTTVSSHLRLNAKSGSYHFKKLLVNTSGLISASDGVPLLVENELNCFGRCDLAKSELIFSGTVSNVRGIDIAVKKLTVFGDLANYARLDVFEGISLSSTASFNNEPLAVLIYHGTKSNISGEAFNFSAPGNSLCFARNGYQSLIHAENGAYSKIEVLNSSNVTMNDFSYSVDSLVLCNRAVVKIFSDSLKNGFSYLSIGNDCRLEMAGENRVKIESVLQSRQDDENHGKISLFFDGELSLKNSSIGSLALNSSKGLKVKLKDNIVFRGDLFIGARVILSADLHSMTFRGNVNGGGELSVDKNKVKYMSDSIQEMFPCEYHYLEIENKKDAISRAQNFIKADKIRVMSGKLSLSSFNAAALINDSLSTLLIGGSNCTIDSVINFGELRVSSENAHIFFRKYFQNDGSFYNAKNADHVLSGTVENRGDFFGCDGSGCSWKIESGLNVYGDSNLEIPRLQLYKGDTLNNYGELTITASIKGDGDLINRSSGHLSLKMNTDQIVCKINAHEEKGNHVHYSRVGDQLVVPEGCRAYSLLSFEGSGNKVIENSIFDFDSLFVKNGSIIQDKGNLVLSSDSSFLGIEDSSYWKVGHEYNENASYLFFPQLKSRNVSLSPNSTVEYLAKGSQYINGRFHYGNLALSDGAVNSSYKIVHGSDSLNVGGGIFVKESSVNLELDGKTVCVAGDFTNVGLVSANNASIFIGGEADNRGEFKGVNSCFTYNGSKDQRIAKGEFDTLRIDKVSGVARLVAGKGELKVRSLLDVSQGKLEIHGERVSILGETEVGGEIELKSRFQEKRFSDINVKKEGKLINAAKEEFAVRGKLIVAGMLQSNGAVSFESDSIRNQLLHVKSQGAAEFSTISLPYRSSFKIKGQVKILDSLLLNEAELLLDSAMVDLAENGALKNWSSYERIVGFESQIKRMLLTERQDTIYDLAGMKVSVAVGDGELEPVYISRIFSRRKELKDSVALIPAVHLDYEGEEGPDHLSIIYAEEDSLDISKFGVYSKRNGEQFFKLSPFHYNVAEQSYGISKPPRAIFDVGSLNLTPLRSSFCRMKPNDVKGVGEELSWSCVLHKGFEELLLVPCSEAGGLEPIWTERLDFQSDFNEYNVVVTGEGLSGCVKLIGVTSKGQVDLDTYSGNITNVDYPQVAIIRRLSNQLCVSDQMEGAEITLFDLSGQEIRKGRGCVSIPESKSEQIVIVSIMHRDKPYFIKVLF